MGRPNPVLKPIPENRGGHGADRFRLAASEGGSKAAARAGRRCGRIILGLEEDRGALERAHNGDGGWSEDFAGERSDRKSMEAAFGPVSDAALRSCSRR
jgi:hypothetical protein